MRQAGSGATIEIPECPHTPKKIWCIGSKVSKKQKNDGEASGGTVGPADGNLKKSSVLTAKPIQPSAVISAVEVMPTAVIANTP